MRPAPHEIIAAMRDLLRENVAPEVTSEEGKLALRRIMAVLRDVNWDDLTLAMARENRELAAMAEVAGEWIGADPGRTKDGSTLLSEITAAAGSAGCPGGFDELQSTNLRLRTVLCHFLAVVSGPEAKPGRVALCLQKDFARRLADLARERALPG